MSLLEAQTAAAGDEDLARLFRELDSMPESGHLRRIDRVVADLPPDRQRPIEGTAFFPGGMGLWNANHLLPTNGVMVIGNTFDSVDNCKEKWPGDYGKCEGRTWDNLRRLFSEAEIQPERCWFTNAYPGVICGLGPEGRIQASADLLRWCQCFFRRSVELMGPSKILALGKEPIRFLGAIADIKSWRTVKTFAGIDRDDAYVTLSCRCGTVKDVFAVALLHPSRRHGNLRYRRLPGAGDVEVNLLQTLRPKPPVHRLELSCCHDN